MGASKEAEKVLYHRLGTDAEEVTNIALEKAIRILGEIYSVYPKKCFYRVFFTVDCIGTIKLEWRESSDKVIVIEVFDSGDIFSFYKTPTLGRNQKWFESDSVKHLLYFLEDAFDELYG